jgi:prepilin-type N-terminal cleavage/methylation domain-containing protein
VVGDHRGRACAFGGRAARDEGLTLIELLVSMVLIGVILAAAASALITFTREASASERRVQATALLNRLHEDFNAIPFDLAANHEAELPPLADLDAEGIVDVDLSADPPTFEGRPIATLPGPTVLGCTPGDAGCDRERFVPETYQELERDDREAYQIYSVVTWIDRSGNGIDDVKRFTTIVTWEWLGRTYSERFDSERAATAFEAGDPTAVRVYLTAPGTVFVGEDNTLLSSFEVAANFTEPVSSASITFARLNAAGDGLVAETIELAGVTPAPSGPGFVRFSADVPTDLGGPMRLGTGVNVVRVSGQVFGLAETVAGAAGIRVVGGDIVLSDLPALPGDTTPPPDPVDPGDDDDLEVPMQNVAIVTESSSVTNVRLTGSGITCDIVITAQVQGLTTTNGTVSMSYNAGPNRPTVSMLPADPTNISPAGTVFTGRLAAGSSHGWKNNQPPVTFDLRAVRSDGQESLRSVGPISLFTGKGSCS